MPRVGGGPGRDPAPHPSPERLALRRAAGLGWLHEVKHNGRRLLAIIAHGELQLISRNGHDCTALFREPFQALADAGLPALLLDGAVPDEPRVAHIDLLTEALRQRRPEAARLFLPSTLHLEGHNLRCCAIGLLRDVEFEPEM